ncbi:MAG: leucine-rich repeat domain-containing protein [Bacteroides sp.]|nr:leucine-rich repeat domain-containing protein [Prevotella sp.]MCM1408509.1 leucine-rich repeat domain-containing protein [Treponema brennaborense]MCM1469330.1 leucine-rich repeat domain-containing protein [Bacteroides sp.]
MRKNVGSVCRFIADRVGGGIFLTSCSNDPDDEPPVKTDPVITIPEDGEKVLGSVDPADAVGDVTVPDGITSLGEGVYKNCTGMTSVVIPDSVTEIGKDAFNGCSALQSVTIPASVKSIGQSAFYGCTALTSITIPAGITEMEYNPFGACTNLTDIKVAADNPAYSSENGILYNKDKTELIAYPSAKGEIDFNTDIASGVKTIGRYAFRGCTELTSAIISANVKTIDRFVFLECTALASVTIPEGVTQVSQGVFRNCPALKSIAIPATAVNHDGNPFWGSSVADITVAAGNTKYTNSDDKKMLLQKDGKKLYGWPTAAGAVTISEGIKDIPITQIGSNAFRECTELTSVTLAPTVKLIEKNAFFDCDKLTEINGLEGTWQQDNNSADSPDKTVIKELTFDIIKERNGTYQFTRLSTEDLDIGENGAMIENGVLVGWVPAPTGSITIPAGVYKINDEAFKGCTGLTEVIIPEGVAEIAQGAFRNCTNLQSITIPASATSIKGHSFRSCPNLKHFTVAADNKGKYFASADGSMLLRVIYAASDYYDEPGACELTAYPSASGAAVIPDIVTGAVDKHMYYITEIASNAIRDNTGLTSITIPGIVEQIGTWAFGGCDNLASVNASGTWVRASKNNNSIWEFEDKDEELTASKLKTDNLTYKFFRTLIITDGVVQYCIHAPADVTIPNGVTKIADNAFDKVDGDITSVTIPNGVTYIGAYAFSDCGSMISLTIPASVTYIGEGAFVYCTALENISYAGTTEQWNNTITKGENIFPEGKKITCSGGDVEYTAEK